MLITDVIQNCSVVSRVEHTARSNGCAASSSLDLDLSALIWAACSSETPRNYSVYIKCKPLRTTDCDLPGPFEVFLVQLVTCN